MQQVSNITHSIDTECPLCLKMLCEPCSTTCGHNFCSFCIYRALQTSQTCPLCREDLHFLNRKNLRTNILLQEFIKASNPKEYEQRLKEQDAERREHERTEISHRKIYIGNEHYIMHTREETMNTHRWKFFVRMDQDIEKYIDRVTIRLHPTFRPSSVVITEPPFELTRIGWGIFLIRVLIHFKPIYNKNDMFTDWMLTFEGNGNMKEIDEEFVSKRIIDLEQQQEQQDLQQEDLPLNEDVDDDEFLEDEDEDEERNYTSGED